MFFLLLLFFNTSIVRVPYSRSSVWQWDFGGKRGSSLLLLAESAKMPGLVWFGVRSCAAFFFFFFRTFEKRKKRRGERRKKNLFPLFVTVTGLKLLGINVPAYSLRGKSALLECR